MSKTEDGPRSSLTQEEIEYRELHGEQDNTRHDCLILPSNSARVGLSIRLGAMGGFIWGLMFTAYYSMLPNYKFAGLAATVCFVVMIIFFLSLPSIIKAFKDAAEERREEKLDEK